MQRNTILKNLRKYYQEDNALRSEGLKEATELSQAEVQEVMQAFEKHGAELLRPIHEEVDGSVSYEELRLLRLYFQNRDS